MSTTLPEVPEGKTPDGNRRPLSARNLAIFRAMASALANAGVSPNAISGSSIVFGGAAGMALAYTAAAEGMWQRVYFAAGALFIQLRLLANMLDGMVAVEGGKAGPTGDLWNEAPDRVSDVATIVGAGYAFGSSPLLGWVAAASALFVAYVRALGASAGVGQVFAGPMAKPQRMFWLTLGSVACAVLPADSGLLIRCIAIFALAAAVLDVKAGWRSVTAMGIMSAASFVFGTWLAYRRNAFVFPQPLLPAILASIAVGGTVTAIIRLREIAARLRARAAVSDR